MSPSRSSDSPAPQFVRAVGLFSLTAIAVNGVIGSGIFVLPATVAALLGPASPMAYLIAALLVALIVLCFAEAGSLFDQSGGPYLYAREAFGGFIGFEVGIFFLLSRLAATAAISNAFAAYLGYIWPPASTGIGRGISITILLGVLAGLNFVGVRYGAWTVNLLTVMKLVPLLLFVSVGLFFLDRTRYELFVWPGSPGFPLMSDLRSASILLVFAFGGFENACVPTEEVKEPRLSLPIALIVSIVVTTALYILIQIVALGTLPDLSENATPLASAGRTFLGPAGAMIITLGAVISTAGSNSALTLVGPRILYAFAQAGQLPAALGRIHPHYRTPHIAIIAFALIACAAAVYGRFSELVAVSAMARLLFSATTCLAVPLLRRKMPGARREFKIPGGFTIPLLAALVSGWLLTGINKVQVVAGVITLVVAAGLYFVFARNKPSH